MKQGISIVIAIAAGIALLAMTASTLRDRSGSAVATRTPQPVVDASSPIDAEPEQAPSPPDVATRPRRPERMNILLITIDTLRWDLGYMGYPRAITPRLDELAERAVVFERAYATASYTPKSLGPLLIGKYASETFRDREHYTTFYPANVFVAERLKAAGYRTVGVMGHHYFKWKTGFDQGFDVWDTTTVPATPRDDDPTITSELLTNVAIRALEDDQAERPFFAWVHYLDPHAPYMAHPEAPDLGPMPPRASQARALYDQEIWFTDRHVGRLLDFVAAKEWAADTAIIITADHGEAFGERGFLRHGRELWEPLVRVPLIVYIPSARAHRVGVRRSHIDVVPTILELAGLPEPTDGPLQGHSLLADVDAERDDEMPERDVFLDMPEGPFNEARRALITGASPGYKLIDFGSDRYELYDLAADPDEMRPIGDPSTRRPIIASLTAMRRSLREAAPAP